MNFTKIKEEWAELRRVQQELSTACYNISVFDSGEGVFKFSSFYDMEQQCMGFAVLDEMNTAIKIVSELPIAVMIAYGEYCKGIRAWESGETEYPPYHHLFTDTATAGADVFTELKEDVMSVKTEIDMSHLIIEDQLNQDKEVSDGKA